MNNNQNELVNQRILCDRITHLRQTTSKLYNETDHEHFIRVYAMATEEEEEYDPLADINEVEKGPLYHIYNFIRYYIS